MIQDIQPKQYHNEYTPRPIREDDVVFVFRGREVLLRQEENGFAFPRGSEVQEENLQYLFAIDDRAFYLGREAVAGYEFSPMKVYASGPVLRGHDGLAPVQLVRGPPVLRQMRKAPAPP